MKYIKRLICLLIVSVSLYSCGKSENQRSVVGLMEASDASAAEEEMTVPVLKSSYDDRFDIKKKVIIDVPYYSQEEYPTGCELISTQMLLEYYGFEVDADLMVRSGLIKVVEFRREGDTVYGGDPNLVFVGNPDKEDGIGCFSGVIIKALEEFLPDDRYEVNDLNGMTLEDICRRYIYDEIPVLVWGSQGMKSTYRGKNNTWIIEDTGEKFTWMSNEHCLVLVGYDEDNYYFNDPTAGKSVKYEKSVVEKRYKELGMQAVAVTYRTS